MDKVLITGGLGYIGSHISFCMIKKGYKVVVLDSLLNSFESSYFNLKTLIDSQGLNSDETLFFEKGDIRDKKFLDSIFFSHAKSNKAISYVIHLAGLKSIKMSMNNPLEYWDINVLGTLSLLSTMSRYKCHNLIYSSSATVYKPKGFNMFKENDDLKPNNPYGKTKLTVEEILNDLFYTNSSNDWKIANLRYFNPAGAHHSGIIGENPKGESTNLFPSILNVIKKKQKQLFIFGNNWPTKDGTCIRDFIHVMDLAEAHISALEYLLSNKSQNIALNIGTGLGTSILEVVEKFSEINQKPIPLKFASKRIGDEAFVVADNSLALKLLNWSPKRNLEIMCKDCINFHN